MKAWNSTLNAGKGFKPRKPWNYKPKRKLRQVRPESVMTPNEAAKARIRSLLRDIVILRDGGCLLRNSPQAGSCGGRRKDGVLILQAEHLHSRRHGISFADTRLVICICRNHHGNFKVQYPDIYYQIVKKLIGPQRTALLERVQQDYKAHKMDWVIEEIALQGELKALQNKVILL